MITTSGTTRRGLGRALLGLQTDPNPVGERNPDMAAAAHLVRRTSMGVHPERIEAAASKSWDDAIDDVLEQPWPDGTATPVPTFDDEDWEGAALWWVNQMTLPDSSLGDRMTWFWHGHLTTNANKVEQPFVGPQLDLLRRNALGNFRTMLQEFVVDAALLQYLDGEGSVASNPNENLGRELMELFTIGAGNYTQNDVRAAARALAGWVIEETDGAPGWRVRFERQNAFIAPIQFLGEQADWDTEMVVDRLCDDPSTHARISSKLWRHLVGTWLTPEAAADLGAFWASKDLEILPLVERILRSDEFASSRLSRPRTGLEWWCGFQTAIGRDETDELWQLQVLGQRPYGPPNVGGWPDDDRWLGPGSMLGRMAQLWNIDAYEVFGTDPAPIDEILDRCAIHEVSPSTLSTLESVSTRTDLSDEARHHLRWGVALSSPEFHLA